MSQSSRSSRGRAAPSRRPEGEGAAKTKIIVQKLTRNVNEGHVREIFGNYGTVKEVAVPMNRQIDANKGFAFITYSTQDEAEAAIAHMDGAQIDGNVVSCAYVQPRPPAEPARAGRGYRDEVDARDARRRGRTPPPNSRYSYRPTYDSRDRAGSRDARKRSLSRDRWNRGAATSYRDSGRDKRPAPAPRKGRSSRSRSRSPAPRKGRSRSPAPRKGRSRSRSYSSRSRSASRSRSPPRKGRGRSRSRSFSSRSRSRSRSYSRSRSRSSRSYSRSRSRGAAKKK
ncbi:hypothetical protein DFJ74DRAFT_667466 [Hyaloraphidium curvatum]|nr:hypothetical protein DFJ74DRAFT_667466 [Hyaloraphidium curvatum]